MLWRVIILIVCLRDHVKRVRYLLLLLLLHHVSSYMHPCADVGHVHIVTCESSLNVWWILLCVLICDLRYPLLVLDICVA